MILQWPDYSWLSQAFHLSNRYSYKIAAQAESENKYHQAEAMYIFFLEKFTFSSFIEHVRKLLETVKTKMNP
jgi:hypothetical protein